MPCAMTHDATRRRVHGVAIRRLGDQGREVFRDGLRADAGRRVPRRDVSRTSATARSRTSASACSKPASCRQTACASTSPPKCGIAPDRLTLLRSAHLKPGRHGANCRPQRRDGTAQTARAGVRSEAALSAASGIGSAAAARGRRSGGDRPDERRDSVRRLRVSLQSTATMTRCKRSARECRAVRRPTTAGHSPRFSRATTTISTASIRCCSARRKVTFCNRRYGQLVYVRRSLHRDVLAESFAKK